MQTEDTVAETETWDSEQKNADDYGVESPAYGLNKEKENIGHGGAAVLMG